jgi:hypothetical protein
MLHKPSPVAALILGIVLVVLVPILPPIPAIKILTGAIIVFSLTDDFRKRVPLLLKVLFPFVFLMSLVALGRIIGGADIERTVEEYLSRFPFVATVVTAATLFAVCVRPWHALAIADVCRLPRKLTYILVSLFPLSSHVRDLGTRQLALLDLKGIDRKTIVGRVLAYRRLVSPLFSSVLSQQVVHAHSLSFRGFFRYKKSLTPPRLNNADAIWALLLLGVIILSVFNSY